VDTHASTFAFLFTDVEGSTRLWERQSSAMGRALARHDEIVRNAVERHGGEVFKTWGDAFCAVFPTAGEGVAAALDLQRAVAGEPWDAAPIVVRCALHAGAAEERDGDYFGPSLNRVARLLAAAHGGQALLSEAASTLARDALPDGVTLIDLGSHRLRDLERHKHIYQLAAPGLRTAFPPIRTLRARHDNVPAEVASFIGRARECADLRALLLSDETRLVTLTGPGGCGKTRLAVHVCGSCIEEFPDGICYVQLAAISDGDLVVPAIAQALNLREGGDSPISEVVQNYLHDKSLLLVLDNFEQVLETGSLVADLIASSKTKMLVTSREPLHLYGEREYRVPPLDLPEPSAEDVLHASASRLFVERAKLADPAFESTAENSRAIAQICRRLDGLPLAIELAAARIQLFSPKAMQERLDSRLSMLTGGARDLPERQRTMRGAIEWSDALLNEAERALFRRLGVFSGGFTLDAAEEVCNVDGGANVIELISSLLGKSLLHRGAGVPTGQRLSMLETIREYARERLESVGGLPLMRDRHAAWSLRQAELLRGEIHGPGQLASLARCEDEHDNFRAALAWYAERDGSDGLRLAVALAPFWRLRRSHAHRRVAADSTGMRSPALVRFARRSCWRS
jgi:predicted ATPase/class 3 adenylate cyclase